MQNGNVRERQSRIQSLAEQIVGQLTTLILAMSTAELFVYEMFGMEVFGNCCKMFGKRLENVWKMFGNA